MAGENLELRRRRALYRATHRGSKELDFILGRFAEQSIESMSATEIGHFEQLIDAPDPDIVAAFYDGVELGAPELDRLMQRLRAFHGYDRAQTS
jgi:antitoxin CptB